jgi:serine/threonine protein kinase
MGDLWSFSNKIPGSLEDGEVIGGHFKVSSKIGQGQAGIVYKAFDENSERFVAIKVLRINGDLGDKRFQREGEITAALNHPGIVKIYGSGEHNNQAYLIYEYIDGQTLEQALKPALTFKDRLRILIEIADALAHAHSKGFIHRDLKANNILIDREGHAHITDFGLAAAPALERLTETGAVVGTPRIMPPELLRGSGHCGPEVDVWAFGILLFRVICDDYPYKGQNLTEYTAAILERAAPSLIFNHGSRYQGLESIYQNCLKRDPARRYPNAAALLNDLNNLSSANRLRPLLYKSLMILVLLSPMTFLGYALLSKGDDFQLKIAFERSKHGKIPVETLESLLSQQQSDDHRDLRSSIYLFLAQERLKTQDWPLAESYAIKALSLNSKLKVEMEMLLGQSRELQERYDDAARSYSRAYQVGGGKRSALCQLRALVCDQQTARALLHAENLIEGGLIQSAELTLFLDHWPATNETQARLKSFVPALEKRIRSADIELLSVKLSGASGAKLTALLQNIVQKYPRHVAAALTLAREQLESGDATAALWTLKKARGDGEKRALVAHYQNQIQSLLSRTEIASIDNQSQLWNKALCRFLMRRSLREIAYHEKQNDPRIIYKLKVTNNTRRQRVSWDMKLAQKIDDTRLYSTISNFLLDKKEQIEAAVFSENPSCQSLLNLIQMHDFIGKQDTRKALAIAEKISSLNPFRKRSSDLLKSQALVLAGQKKQAIQLLENLHEEICQDKRICIQLCSLYQGFHNKDKVLEHKLHLQLLNRRRFLEAQNHYADYKDARRSSLTSKQLKSKLTKVVENYPLYWEAHFKRALIIIAERKLVEGLSLCTEVLQFDPHLSSELLGFFQIAWTPGEFFKHSEAFQWELLVKQCPGGEKGEHLRAIIQSFAVEKLNRRELIKPTIKLLDKIIEQRPWDTTAWLQRAFLYTRSGQFHLAWRDLGIAREDHPKNVLFHFYKALLLAAEGRAKKLVLAELKEVPKCDFPIWKRAGWDPRVYGEFDSYAEDREIRQLLGFK